MANPLRAIVLAAGKGTRMNSSRPKVLHEAAGRPLLHYVLDLCAELGAQTSVVVGHQAEAVRASCTGRGDISFALQEPQHGTGHATQVALRDIAVEPGVPVLVLAGDVPLLRAETLRELCALRQGSNAAVALVSFKATKPAAYGRIVRDAKGRVRRIVEARDATPAELDIDEMNASLYVFDGDKLRATLPDLRANNAQGELYLTDLVGLMAQAGERVEALLVADPLETSGVNTTA